MNCKHHHLTFELKDSWLEETGMTSFKPESQYYPFAQRQDGRAVYIIDIADIAPCEQRATTIGVFCDKAGELTAKERVVSILQGFRDKRLIEAVEIKPYKGERAYKYQMHHGSHRLHSAIGVGFTQIPAVFSWSSLRKTKRGELVGKDG
jgi:hypothetical protein